MKKIKTIYEKENHFQRLEETEKRLYPSFHVANNLLKSETLTHHPFTAWQDVCTSQKYLFSWRLNSSVLQKDNKYTKRNTGSSSWPSHCVCTSCHGADKSRSSQQTSSALSPLVLLCLLLRGSWEWCRDFPTTLMGADTELSSLVFTIHYDSKTPLGHPSQTQTHELGDAAQVSCLMRLVVLSAIALNLMNKMPTWKSGRFARSKRKYTEKRSCK